MAQEGAHSHGFGPATNRLWTGTDEDKWVGWLHIVEAGTGRCRLSARLCRGDEASVGSPTSSCWGWVDRAWGRKCSAETFGRQPGWPRFHVLDSTDPAQIRAIEREIDLGKTLFIVSSKSGSTLEPNIFMAYFFERVGRAAGKDKAGEQFVAMTDPGSSLEKPREAARLRAHLPWRAPRSADGIPCCRSSVWCRRRRWVSTSNACSRRTQPMERACGADVPPAENPGVQLGIAMGVAAKRFGRDKVTIIASPGIADLGAWLEQLLAESTGKHGRGLIPLADEPLATPERLRERPVLRLP